MDKETKNNSVPHAPVQHNNQQQSHHKTEAFGISDKELNSKDEMTKRLTISFDWIVANKFFVIFFLGILFVSGLGYVVYDKTKMDTELKIQEKYFVVEKAFLDQRAKFDEAEREQKAELDKAKSPAAAKGKAAPEAEVKTPKVLASGDLEKDYGTVVKEFNDLLTAQPKSLAGKMTSLLLADIYSDYNKHEDALASLNKSAINNPKTLIDLLVSKKKVNAMLSLNQFAEAEKELLMLINQKTYPFLTSQFKLLLGLSYEGLKQWDKAETQFQEIIAKGLDAENLPPEEMAKRNRFSSDVSAYEQAQKYLILLKLKKDSEKAGS